MDYVKRSIALSLAVLAVATGIAAPLGNAFTYQGQIKVNGETGSGNFNLEFSLWDAATDGNQVGSTVALAGVPVVEGLFTVQLNQAGEFGPGSFNGEARWMSISVNGTPLTPRQLVMGAPYALFSTAPWATLGSNIFYNGGNIGVGTNVPQSQLHITGTMTCGQAGVNNGEIILEDSGAISNNPGIRTNANGDLILRTHSSPGSIQFESGNPEATNMLLTGSGNLGIGTTSPDRPLSIAGTGPNGEMLSFKSSAGVTRWHVNNLLGGLNFAQTGFGDARLFLATSGRVGIGTNTPDARLEVANNEQADHAIMGIATLGAGSIGVIGQSNVSDGTGVYGRCEEGASAYGVWGISSSGFAGYFNGRVHVSGSLSKLSGSFKIDHPMDPENKTLTHSFVESPDMMNVYNGNATTDASGEAWIELPHYFETLNRDFRYQLTVIEDNDTDGFCMAKVARGVRDNRFKIKTSAPGVSVSWQVTGIRKDPWAERNRIVVEEEKPDWMRGKYLAPSAYDLPEERGVCHKTPIRAKSGGAEPDK